jgi:site-specific recombinase XerD
MPESLLISEIKELSELGAEIIPVSARKGKNLKELIKVVVSKLPEGDKIFEQDIISDRSERFMVGEIIREKILLKFEREIPHGIAVLINKFKLREDGKVYDISVDIICEKPNHKAILIGKQGSAIKQVSTFARTDLENNNTTRNRKLSSLKSFYRHFYTKKHMLDKNPTEAIDSIKKSRTLSKYLSVEEAVALLEAVSNDKESKTRQRDYSIISLFLNTGMRLSELCGLNLESFDREISYVKVIGKGNKERIIYLNTAAKDAVISYLKIRLDPRFIHTSEHAFFLSARQTRISPKTVQWMVGKYLDLAGLGSKGYSVHKLRHTAATLMYQSGKVDVRVLKDILGHEQLNTTQIYTHLVNRNMEEAMYNNPLSDFTVKKQ